MRRAFVAFSALALALTALAGCGLYRHAQREAWRTQAEEACLARKQVRPSAHVVRIAEVGGPGSCGITYPFKVAAFAEASVGLRTPVTLGCPIIPNIDGWIAEVVQPAAQLYYDTAVVEVRAGSYSCRSRNNQRGAKMSEHAYGNALDVMAFRFADGRDLAVKTGWRGDPIDQDFLREIFVAACAYFTTVLGPGADPHHGDHFHFDLARHDARFERRVCKPVLKFTPRLDAAGPATAPPPRKRPQPLPREAPATDEPFEIDEDNDPFAVSAPQRPAPPIRQAERPPAPPRVAASPVRPAAAPERPPAPRPRVAAPGPRLQPLALSPSAFNEDGIY